MIYNAQAGSKGLKKELPMHAQKKVHMRNQSSRQQFGMLVMSEDEAIKRKNDIPMRQRLQNELQLFDEERPR